jgi:hypothetical protein
MESYDNCIAARAGFFHQSICDAFGDLALLIDGAAG